MLLPAANTGLEENSDIPRMSVCDTQEDFMFASLANFVNLWKLKKEACLTFECEEGTVKVNCRYGPGHPDRQVKEEKKRKSNAKISRGHERAAAHQAKTLAKININNSKLKNQINLQNDEISQLKKKLASSHEKTAELTDSNTVLETKSKETRMTNMKMDKLLAKVVELTNTNTTLVKALAAKTEEADKTSTELEKVLATLAEREAAKDQLSDEVTHYRTVLAQIECITEPRKISWAQVVKRPFTVVEELPRPPVFSSQVKAVTTKPCLKLLDEETQSARGREEWSKVQKSNKRIGYQRIIHKHITLKLASGRELCRHGNLFSCYCCAVAAVEKCITDPTSQREISRGQVVKNSGGE